MHLTDSIDCACVIHGDAYTWEYVEKLYGMLQANLSQPVRMHVFTESTRTVPEPFVKHSLVDWPGIHGRRRAWWYKMQMFDPAHNIGQVLYFDLDVVITGNIDWITQLDPAYFWTIRDFRKIWRPSWQGINSSVMFWNVDLYAGLWHKFVQNDLNTVTTMHAGDQDFLTDNIPAGSLRFFGDNTVKSWRWEIFDGGIDPHTRKYLQPGAGTIMTRDTQIVVFHGNPKQHEITDNTMLTYWNININTSKGTNK
jgi:hypothetical protein